MEIWTRNRTQDGQDKDRKDMDRKLNGNEDLENGTWNNWDHKWIWQPNTGYSIKYSLIMDIQM